MEKKKLTEIICLYNAKTKAVVDFVVLTLLLSAVIEFLFFKKKLLSCAFKHYCYHEGMFP